MNTPITTAWIKEWAGDSPYADPIVIDAAETMGQLERQIEATARRGMTEAARLRGHITMMAGWIKQVRCQCTERIGCARCMALACAEVDYAKSKREAAESTDETPDGQAENAKGMAPGANE